MTYKNSGVRIVVLAVSRLLGRDRAGDPSQDLVELVVVFVDVGGDGSSALALRSR